MLHYHLAATGASLAQVFHHLELARNQYSIEDYSVSQTTLDQVSLKMYTCVNSFSKLNLLYYRYSSYVNGEMSAMKELTESLGTSYFCFLYNAFVLSLELV